MKIIAVLLVIITKWSLMSHAFADELVSPAESTKASQILVLSAVLTLDTIPQSFSDKAASIGRDITSFNAALDSTLASALSARLSTIGVKNAVARSVYGKSTKLITELSEEDRRRRFSQLASISFGGLPSKRAKSAAKAESTPNLTVAVTVEPSKVNTNIPGSFSGEFVVAVMDTSTGRLLWSEIISQSAYANGKAHEEVGRSLANIILAKLSEIGLI